MPDNTAIMFLEPGSTVNYRELANADCVVGVLPDGAGRVIKNRYGREDDLTAEQVEWLRANPSNSPEDAP